MHLWAAAVIVGPEMLLPARRDMLSVGRDDCLDLLDDSLPVNVNNSVSRKNDYRRFGTHRNSSLSASVVNTMYAYNRKCCLEKYRKISLAFV